MQIAWVEAALLDIAVIKARIAADDPRAADQQVQRVLRAIARLVEFPRLGREGRISGTRELIVSRTPLSRGVSDNRRHHPHFAGPAWPPALAGKAVTKSNPEQIRVSTLEFKPERCYITAMTAARIGMRRIIGPILG